VTALVATDGDVVERYMYDPYGQVLVLNGADDADDQVSDWSEDADNTSDWDNEVLFAGYRFDSETGLCHVRHRSYHPTEGRWMQRDPIGYRDGMGLYEYATSRAITQVDPYGLLSLRDLWEWVVGEGEEAVGKCYRMEERNLTEDAWLLVVSPHPASLKTMDGQTGFVNRAMYLWGRPYSTLWLCCDRGASQCKWIWGDVDMKYGLATRNTSRYRAFVFQPPIPIPLPWGNAGDLNKLLGIETPSFYVLDHEEPGYAPAKPGEESFEDPDGNPPPEGYIEVSEPPCSASGESGPPPEAPNKPPTMIMRAAEKVHKTREWLEEWLKQWREE
jgi:RHS repeat-associated protein